jgi:hypothetical protein
VATRSTVPTVKAALVALLDARAGLVGVQLAYSHPGAAIEPEAVYLGGVRGTNVYPVMRAGRKPRDETYTVDVWFEAVRDGTSSQEAEERVWALYGELEDTVADDPTLGLSFVGWARISDWDDMLAFDLKRQGWSARIRAGLEINARLT